MISSEEIKKLASLSRISIEEEELPSLEKDLNSVLDYVGELQKVGGKEDPVISEKRNVFRSDGEPHESGVFTDSIIKNAPDHTDDYIKVRKIL